MAGGANELWVTNSWETTLFESRGDERLWLDEAGGATAGVLERTCPWTERPMTSSLPRRQRTAAIRNLAENTWAHPKNEIRPLHTPPPRDEASTRYTIAASFPRLYLESHRKQELTAKIAKNSREERKENRRYSEGDEHVHSKTPFFANFASPSRFSRLKAFVLMLGTDGLSKSEVACA
jgi:hypothetical protein